MGIIVLVRLVALILGGLGFAVRVGEGTSRRRWCRW
jgi:hypothetical protein